MNIIADFHIHSPFSRATSKSSDLPGLFSWARVKGINVVGTGDFTHPAWLQQLKQFLEPAEPGLFRLRDERSVPQIQDITPENIPVRFLLTAEISSIYKRHGKVRKVHNILFVPDFSGAEKINMKLAAIGNIESDGRPILGLDSRDLLEILLENCPDGFLVPAHIWTPWFSLFGSKSGFDSIEDCFGDLTDHIFALETGLSSDPDMNRLISSLDRYTLISNSDCHSPAKLGREVNIFDAEFDYFALRKALEFPQLNTFKGTIEFFPEEGKYHFDGHRKCNVCLEPIETKKLNSICPVCGKLLAVGVSHRVLELADRSTPLFGQYDPGFKSLIPLPEVLGEMLGRGPATKGVLSLYAQVINRFGSEFSMYMDAPEEDLKLFSPLLAEAVTRIRNNKVIRTPGYDGEFGVIKVFEPGEISAVAGQKALFTLQRKWRKTIPGPQPDFFGSNHTKNIAGNSRHSKALSDEQAAAVRSDKAQILVTAGPGTGKTFTLIEKIVNALSLTEDSAVKFWAITFTNKAADEIKARLQKRIGDAAADDMFVGTFHAFCLYWLKTIYPDLKVVGQDDRELVAKKLYPSLNSADRKKLCRDIEEYYESLATTDTPSGVTPSSPIETYDSYLEAGTMIDIDAIIPVLVKMLREDTKLAEHIASRVKHLFVDEFQDLNCSQYRLVRMLADSARVFAIGDPNQAIYGFRGSKPEFFFDFQNLQDVVSYSLSTNYRSIATIVSASSAVIANNRQKAQFSLRSLHNKSSKIMYAKVPSANAEAEFVVKTVEKIMGGISHFSINSGRGGSTDSTLSFSDIAVLCRLHSHAAEISQGFERRGIPYQLIGVTPYFKKPPLAPLYYWLLVAGEKASLADYVRLFASWKGIGRTTAEKIEKLPLVTPDLWKEIENLDISATSRDLIRGIRKDIALFQQEVETSNLAHVIEKNLPLFKLKLENSDLRRLIRMAGAFGRNLKEFAAHLQEHSKSTVYDERAEAIAVMTVHAAKGLEFPVVFMPVMEEGIFPHTLNEHYDMEEERRLFYVGMTRAKRQLYLSAAGSRLHYGETCENRPSRFISEIPSNLLVRHTPDIPGKRHNQISQLSLF